MSGLSNGTHGTDGTASLGLGAAAGRAALRGRWRAAGSVVALATVVYVGVLGVGVVVGADPDPVRLALVLALVAAAVLLVLTVSGASPAPWDPSTPPSPLAAGRDPLTDLYLRVLEDHHHAVDPDHALVRRLAALTARVLRERHGLETGDPGAAALLGPELLDLVSTDHAADRGAERLSPRRIADLITAIEEI